MNPEDKVLPLKEEAPKEGKEPLSKDNEAKTEKAKGARKKKASAKTKTRTRKEIVESVIEKAERHRKGLKNRLGNSRFFFWRDINNHDRKSLFEMTASLPGFKSEEEIAIACGTDLATLQGWCVENYGGQDGASAMTATIKKLRAMDKRNFLISQHDLALGQPAMSIWLGKNYYGQKEADDKKELDLSDFFNVIIKPKMGAK